MPLNQGLAAADFAAYCAQVVTHQQLRSTAYILDLDQNPLIDVSAFLEDGQTNIDTTATISRSATVALFDPTRTIGFDTVNPSAGSVSPKYMLQKKRGVFVTALGKWVDFPTFTGPIAAPTRDGDVLSLVGNGKEQLALNKALVPLTVKKGTDKATAIRTIMLAVGESFFRLTSTSGLAGLAADVTVTREDTHWDIAKTIATGLGWNLFYDAEGYLVLRPSSLTPVFDFRTGDGGSIQTQWQIGYNSNGVYDVVYATGATPSGKTDPISAIAYAPAGSALDPLNLGRGSPKTPIYMRYDVSDDTLTKQADVQTLANNTLPKALLESVSIAFESLPIVHLEEYDCVTATDTHTGISNQTIMQTWSIPDSSAGTQSNGYLKPVSRSARILAKTIR